MRELFQNKLSVTKEERVCGEDVPNVPRVPESQPRTQSPTALCLFLGTAF